MTTTGITSLFDQLPLIPKPARAGGAPDEKQEPIYIIVVDGVPVPWGRAGARIVYPRDRSHKPFIQFYTTKETENYEKEVRLAARYVAGDAAPLDQPLGILIRIFLPLLKTSEKKRAAMLRGDILPATRPDIDNYIKAALDGMNEVIYVDDGRITDICVRKRYSDRPRMEIEVYA